MCRSEARSRLLPSLLLLCLSGTVLAQSAEELLNEIQARKERINQFRALLNDPDQSTRLAALDVMLSSDDPAMKEIAYGIGFNSADEAMRALTLKGKFRDITMLPFTLSTSKDPTETEKNTLEKLAGAYSFRLNEFDADSGRFTFFGPDYPGSKRSGQISGTRVSFQSHLCQGDLTLGDGAVLSGELRCRRNFQGSYSATVSLH